MAKAKLASEDASRTPSAIPLTIVENAESPATCVLIERKSEFTGVAIHCDSAEKLRDFIDAVRSAHPQARHVAYAAVFAADGSYRERMSDDGEPSGTAGKPILSLLRQRGLTDVAVAVARHFGGVLLGAGGLVRAYSSAATLALDNAHVAQMVPFAVLEGDVQYSQLATLETIARRSGAEVVKKDFSDSVTVTVIVPAADESAFMQSTQDAFNAKLCLRRSKSIVRAQSISGSYNR